MIRHLNSSLSDINSNFNNVTRRVYYSNVSQNGYFKITCLGNSNGRICSLIALHNTLSFNGTGYVTPQLYLLTGINTSSELKALKLINLCNGNATINESAFIENSHASFYFKIQVPEWSNITIIPLLEVGTYSVEFVSD